MKRFLLHTILFAGALFTVACNTTISDEVLESPTERPFAEDVLLVKFTPDVAELIAREGATRGGVATRSGNRAVDNVMEAIDCYKIERVFPIDPRTEQRTREEGLHLWHVVYFDARHSIEEAAHRFSQLGEVCRIDLNHTVKRAYNGKATPLSKERVEAMSRNATRLATMNDPLLGEQWNLINNGDLFCKGGVVKSVKDADVQCAEAWERSTGDESVIVAVLDEGVFIEHPDLKDNIWTNEDEIYRSNEDNDLNGYIGDRHGYNFVHNSGIIISDDYYDSGHGTHVAGVISAVNNNGEGIASIAGGNGAGDGVKIMVCQIFSGNYATSILSTVRAIKYAADNGAVVLQCSWGYVSSRANIVDWGEAGFGTLEEWIAGSPLEREALEYFTHRAGSANGPIEGGIAVFAGGNESAAMAGFPGAADEYVSVAATAADFTPAVYTNYGPGTTISAPGGDQDYYYDYIDETHNYGEVGCILSTLPFHISESGYGFMEGTSMACPHVSAVVALGISYAAQQRLHFKASELQELLYSTATPIDQYFNDKKSYCRYVADIGPIRTMQINMANYRGQMGHGQVNAAALLAAIANAGSDMRFPNLYIAEQGECAIVPSRYFVGGEMLTYRVTIADQTIASCIADNDRLIFKGLTSGATTASITASNGTTHNFTITVRRAASGDGWL